MNSPQATEDQNSFEILVSNIFDYAGMFPPESLSFKQAFSTSFGFSTKLARPHLVNAEFVCSVEQLSDLAKHLKQNRFPGTFRVCSLGGVLKNKMDLISERALEEMNAIQSFNQQLSGQARIKSYEIKIDTALLGDLGSVRIALRNLGSFLQEEDLQLFVEAPTSSPQYFRFISSLAEVNSALGHQLMAPKIRCAPPAPAADLLASIIEHICSLNLGVKFTAGLHHPLIDQQNPDQLGFLSLIYALMLRRANRDFHSEHIMRCLNCDLFSNFQAGDLIGFGGFQISKQKLIEVKKLFHCSIGSCNLFQPDTELNAMSPLAA